MKQFSEIQTEKPIKYEWYEDKTGGDDNKYFSYWIRYNMLKEFGITRKNIEKLCDFLHLLPHVKDIILARTEQELYEEHNESWKIMRDKIEPSSMNLRRHGRNCWCTARDILMDGFFTKCIELGIKKYFPELDFKINGQDNVLDIQPRVDLTPDFTIKGGKVQIEMKIKVEDTNWSPNTYTLRGKDITSQYRQYTMFALEKPLFFLRFNKTKKEFAIINFNNFRPSYSNDGTYFAKFHPISYAGISFTQLIKLIGNEIKDKIRY